MRSRTRGILAAILYIILLIVLPRVVLSMLPAELSRMLSMTSFNLEAILLGLTYPGVALALLALARGFANPRSFVNLGAGILSRLVRFYLLLFVIGLGQPWSFGQMEIGGQAEQVTLTFLLDLRFFVALDAVILGLGIAKDSLEHLSLRRVVPAEQPSEKPSGGEAAEAPQGGAPPSTTEAPAPKAKETELHSA